jgi:hypothetical protein
LPLRLPGGDPAGAQAGMPMNAANWISAPIARSNKAAMATTAAAMLFLACYELEEYHPLDFMRANAVLLIAMHAVLHAVTLNSLRLMGMLEIAEAKSALERYRDPRRVSHLDLAAAWLGYYALSPCIAAL